MLSGAMRVGRPWWRWIWERYGASEDVAVVVVEGREMAETEAGRERDEEEEAVWVK